MDAMRCGALPLMARSWMLPSDRGGGGRRRRRFQYCRVGWSRAPLQALVLAGWLAGWLVLGGATITLRGRAPGYPRLMDDDLILGLSARCTNDAAMRRFFQLVRSARLLEGNYPVELPQPVSGGKQTAKHHSTEPTTPILRLIPASP